MARSVLNVCPRCGLPYSYVEERKVGDRVYYYAVHYSRVNGRRYVHRCYLGPSVYEYVSRLHQREGLVLKGLSDPERILDYLDAIINYIKLKNIDPDLSKRIKSRARKLLKILKELEQQESAPQIYGARVM